MHRYLSSKSSKDVKVSPLACLQLCCSWRVVVKLWMTSSIGAMLNGRDRTYVWPCVMARQPSSIILRRMVSSLPQSHGTKEIYWQLHSHCQCQRSRHHLHLSQWHEMEKNKYNLNVKINMLINKKLKLICTAKMVKFLGSYLIHNCTKHHSYNVNLDLQCLNKKYNWKWPLGKLDGTDGL